MSTIVTTINLFAGQIEEYSSKNKLDFVGGIIKKEGTNYLNGMIPNMKTAFNRTGSLLFAFDLS